MVKTGLIAFLIMVTGAVLTAAPPAVASTGPGLFGSREIRSTNLALFSKWTGMLKRFERRHPAADCQPSRVRRCYFQEWAKFRDQIRDLPLAQKLDVINAHLNQAVYITDMYNWGVPDYWETPGEFLRRDGDCEDYAIAKYFTLRALGFDPAKMRIVVLQDLNLRVSHAVLAVFVGGHRLILDNQIPTVVEDTAIYHYRPIYSINEQAWWLHKQPKN